MAEPGEQDGSGVVVKYPKGPQVSASDKAVQAILTEADRIYFGTLDRAIAHPMFGATLVGLAILVIVLFYLSRCDRARFKAQYEDRRKRLAERKRRPDVE